MSVCPDSRSREMGISAPAQPQCLLRRCQCQVPASARRQMQKQHSRGAHLLSSAKLNLPSFEGGNRVSKPFIVRSCLAYTRGRLFIDFSEPSCHDMTMTMTWLTCMHWHRHRRHQEPCETECSCLPFALPHVVFRLLYSSSSLSIIYFSPRFSLHAQEDSNRGLSRHRGFSVRRAGIRAMVPIF